MASVAKRPDGMWRARYRDAAGREHSKHKARKVDAQRWLDEQTAGIVRGDWVNPKAGRVTVRAYATRWAAVQVGSAGTARIVDNALRLHVLPVLGDRAIGTVRRSDVQALVKGLEAKTKADGSPALAASTIGGIYQVVAQVFGAAVEDRVISETPCRRIRLPKSDDAPVVPPTVEEVGAVLDALDPRWRALVVVLAGAGPRIGEALGLDVPDVDFLRRSVSIARQRNQAGAYAPLKTKSSRRVVPVGRIVVDELAAHVQRFRPGQAATAGPLFVDEFGDALRYRRWRTIWNAAARKAGVEFTSHDLRHFYASALIQGGASVKQVQERLGHGSAVVTLETYGHLWPGEDDRTRAVIDNVLAPLADQPRTSEVRDA